MTDMRPAVIITTEIYCPANPGPSGTAAVLTSGEHKKVLSFRLEATTNNRAEIETALAAIAALKRPAQVTIRCSSKYLADGINDGIASWKAANWRTKAKKPVSNAELWQCLDAAMATHSIIAEFAPACDRTDLALEAQQAARAQMRAAA